MVTLKIEAIHLGYEVENKFLVPDNCGQHSQSWLTYLRIVLREMNVNVYLFNPLLLGILFSVAEPNQLQTIWSHIIMNSSICLFSSPSPSHTSHPQTLDFCLLFSFLSSTGKPSAWSTYLMRTGSTEDVCHYWTQISSIGKTQISVCFQVSEMTVGPCLLAWGK